MGGRFQSASIKFPAKFCRCSKGRTLCRKKKRKECGTRKFHARLQLKLGVQLKLPYPPGNVKIRTLHTPKDSAPREFQSCLSEVRCRAQRLATRPLRVEAAAYRGKPVYFNLVSPWTKPDRMEE